MLHGGRMTTRKDHLLWALADILTFLLPKSKEMVFEALECAENYSIIALQRAPELVPSPGCCIRTGGENP